MITVVLTIVSLGFAIGLLLGALAERLTAGEDPVVAEIAAMMPGSQCAQCGLTGCAQAAEAIARGEVSPTICPPGGAGLARRIAERLGLVLDEGAVDGIKVQVAIVEEELCIGCAKCSQVCPTDAIIGAPKQMHSVLLDFCTGCGLCVDQCPTQTLHLHNMGHDLQNWRWPKPSPTTRPSQKPKAA